MEHLVCQFRSLFKGVIFTVCFVSLVGGNCSADKKETIREMHDRCETGLNAILSQRNLYRSELDRLKGTLGGMFLSENGDPLDDVDGLIGRLEQLKIELSQLSEEDQAGRINVIEKIQAVAQQLKAHDVLIDTLASFVPQDVTANQEEGAENQLDIKDKIQLWVEKYNSIIQEREGLSKEKEILDKEIDEKKKELNKLRGDLTTTRKRFKELEGYFYNIVNVVAQSQE